MKNEQSKLGELFQQAFEDFKPEPNSGLWDKIAQRPELQSPVKPSSGSSLWKFMLGGASIIAVVVAVVLSVNTSEKTNNSNQAVPAVVNNTAVAENNTARPASEPQQTTAVTPDNKSVQKSMTQSTEASRQNSVSEPVIAPMPLKKDVQVQNSENNPVVAKTNAVSTVHSLSVSPAKQVSNSKPTENYSTENNRYNSSSNDGIEVIQSQKWCNCDVLTLWAKGGTNYLWNTGETTETIKVNPTSTTTYSVSVTDHAGVMTPFDIDITVVNCKPINIPNAFSPNNDGINDVFKVKYHDVSEFSNFSMRVASRTGQILFETRDYDQGWDGRIKGQIAEMGIYIYQISYTDITGKTRNESGSLTLLKQ